eukprot:8452473-Alexandrium_andersonii.AAC.1
MRRHFEGSCWTAQRCYEAYGTDAMCPRCKSAPEDEWHRFVDCPCNEGLIVQSGVVDAHSKVSR